MPPKQKEVKKGPVYKPPTPLKDLVPPEIKEVPRDPVPIKSPESFPEPNKNAQSLPSVFEEWPTEEAVKAYDFAGNEAHKYADPSHDEIKVYLEKQHGAEWKSIAQIEHLRREAIENERQSSERFSEEKIQENKKAIVMVETSWRAETEEETQARLKMEAEKAEKAGKDKKKGKKEEIKNEGPIQVSQVKLSDILIEKYFPIKAIWIGSQLQLIKRCQLVDVYTGESIWKKIYPQENGVPIISRSGKYWVKLLHMGRQIKVEVDDRIPVDTNHRELFPVSALQHQKWTLILTKALIKYLSKVSPQEEVVGNGLVVYALTGMLSENTPLRKFNEWAKIEESLSDQNYLKRNIVLSCFTRRPYNHKHGTSVKNVSPTKEEHQKGERRNSIKLEEDLIMKDETEIVEGYSYCVGDYFGTGKFNMVFAQEKSQKQMVLKLEYNQLCKIPLNSKGREEKLEFRRKKKQIKEKLFIEERKRLQLISQPVSEHHFLKIIANIPLQCEYSQKEIFLAKKCIINGLTQPPNYDIPVEKEDKQLKSMPSLSVVKLKEEGSFQQKDESQLAPNLQDFSSMENVVELLVRAEEGVWVKDADWTEAFQEVQAYYNPCMYHHRKIEDCTSKRAEAFTHDEAKEVLVVEGAEAEKVSLLFGFSHQRSKHETLCDPFCVLQKFDFDSFRATSEVVRLERSLSSKIIHLGNLNSVFKLYTISKGNYAYWLSSTCAAKFCSIADYLAEYEGYTRKTFPVEYAPIEAKNYTIVSKLLLKQGEGQNTALIKLINLKEEMLNSLNIRLIKDSNGHPSTIQRNEGVIQTPYEWLFIADSYTRLVLQPHSQYTLLFEANSQQNIAEGSLEIMILSKREGLQMEPLEQVQPVKFIEKYNPNNYGLIFKERLFTNADNRVSFSVKIVEGVEQAAGGAADKKPAKKGGKEEPAVEIIQKPLKEKRKIILKVLDGVDVLYEAMGMNEVVVPALNLMSTKGKKEYFLELRFDLLDWPEAQLKHQQTSKLCWTVQIVSQDSIALVRDTKQEDRQKLTRKSWEDSQPGRAERAKKTRRKFLLELKKEAGHPLTEEQEQILNAPRLTKKQQIEEDRKAQEKKGAKGKKEEKKPGKDAKKEEVVEEKVVERQAPRSGNNFMKEIKEYLQILERCRVTHEATEGQNQIRSEEELKAIQEGARMVQQNRIGQLLRSIEKRESVKLREKERRDNINIFYDEAKAGLKQSLGEYYQWRTQDQQKEKLRLEREKALVDVLSQEKPNIPEANLKKLAADYKEVEAHNPLLLEVAEKLRKNMRIQAISQKITGCLPNWEIQELKAIAQEIHRDRIEGINADIAKQMHEMLEEAEKNPTIAAEKQAQAKKGKKGGKK